MLDAYRFVDQAFYYWAHIIVMEQNEIPSPALWQQVKLLNLGVYKMYEDLRQVRRLWLSESNWRCWPADFLSLPRARNAGNPLLEWIKEHDARSLSRTCCSMPNSGRSLTICLCC
ncbi:hypothetical protein [Paenibacillus popilliae]|uniref:hypothetical protein n=1 Tax=Paenibacillus popilliae TaxID=78057 RepID=UPI003BF4D4AB